MKDPSSMAAFAKKTNTFASRSLSPTPIVVSLLWRHITKHWNLSNLPIPITSFFAKATKQQKKHKQNSGFCFLYTLEDWHASPPNHHEFKDASFTSTLYQSHVSQTILTNVCFNSQAAKKPQTKGRKVLHQHSSLKDNHGSQLLTVADHAQQTGQDTNHHLCSCLLESLASEGSSHHGSLGNSPHRNSSWTETLFPFPVGRKR